MIRFLRQLAVAALALSLTSIARAEWLVYELTFEVEQSSSQNFHFYSGAYAIVPLYGGPASIVLTTDEDGRYYACAEEAARYFMAARAEQQRAVLSALALSGSSQAYYVASGEVDHTMALPSEEGWRSYRVASVLDGQLVASDDDSEAIDVPQDGAVGMVGVASISGRLREDLTLNATQFVTQRDVMWYLVGLLERYGYTADGDHGMAADSVETGEMASPNPPLDDAILNPLFPAGSDLEAARELDESLFGTGLFE